LFLAWLLRLAARDPGGLSPMGVSMTDEGRLQPPVENQSRASARDFAPMRLESLPDRPLVSVLIPSYNYGRYVGLTLESLLGQTYPNFEAVVCDDGSSDNSIEVIQKYAAQDSRIKLLPKEHGGIASAMSTAYANSRGEIISLLDSDDVFKPSKLEKVVAAFRSNPRSGVFMHRVQTVFAAGQPFGPPKPEVLEHGWLAPRALRRGGYTLHAPGPGLAFRREAVSELFPLPLPTSIAYTSDAYLVLCAQFITEISATDECLTEYRIHGGNVYGLHRADLFPAKGDIEERELFISLQKDFLRRVYRPELPEMLRLEDLGNYWRALLAYRALHGKTAGTIRPFSEEEMIRHVPYDTEGRIWPFILKMPDPLAKRAYCFWRGSAGWQRVVRAIFRRWL
jgi:glycosyltransferase involved in cell wall biosynthesis